MVKCKYVFKGHKFNSEAELDDFLLDNMHNLYSKYGDKVFQSRESVKACEKLKEIAKEAKQYQKAYQEAKRKYLDGEDDIEFKPPYVGVTTFLKGLKNEKDKLLTPEFREKEYWLKRIKSWKDPNEGFNDEELSLFGNNVAVTDNVSDLDLVDYLELYEKGNTNTSNLTLKLIKEVKDKWVFQGKAGTDIHAVLLTLFTSDKNGEILISKNRAIIDSVLKNKSYLFLNKSHVSNIVDYAILLHKELQSTLGDDLTFFPEFLIASKLSLNIEGKGDTVLGIIDLLVIDKNGDAHVIDYKASPKPIFNSAKERGFAYQLGLYNRMLLNHGLSTDSITPKVMVAPIKMEGFRKDGDTFVFDSVVLRDSDCLTDITAKSTLREVAENLSEFIPLNLKVNLAPIDLVKSVTLFESKAFEGLSTSKSWTDEEIKKYIEDKGIDSEVILNIAKGETDADKVFNAVKKYYTEILPKKHKDIVLSVKIALRKGIKEGANAMELPKSYTTSSDASSSWFYNLVSKYCRKEWEIEENDHLDAYGIITLRNKLTNLIDFLKVTSENLHFEHKFNGSNRRKLITGAFETDSKQAKKLKSLAFAAKNGNIQLMEMMAVINCMPKITENNFVIGNIQIANPSSLQGMSASNEELIYNFKELSSHIKGYTNNIKDIKFATKTQLARNKLKEIISYGNTIGWTDFKYKKFKSYTDILTELDGSISEADSKKSLRLLDSLRVLLEKNFKKDIETTLDSYSEDLNPARSLYDKVVLAMADLQGFTLRQQTADNSNTVESMEFHRNGVQSLMLDNAGNLNNDTLNLLTKLVTEAYQNVREDVQREMVTIRRMVNDLKEAKGFSKFEEMTTGNLALLYKGMTKFENGDFLFKKPEEVDPKDRKFLEYVLQKINEDRFGVEADAMKSTIEYYRVPLAIGDDSSSAAQLGGLYKGLLNRLSRLSPKKWKENVERMLLKLTGVFSDVNKLSSGADLYQMNNVFETGTTDERLQFIAEKGELYFENNLETLLIKHLFAYSSLRHINKIMPMAKASMIHLVSQGHLTNKKYENATNYVANYIRNKIKNESIVDPKFKLVASFLGELKLAASFMVLGFSPILYPYQILQGLWTDIRLMYQNLDGPFSLENFKSAMGDVYQDMFKLGGKPTKCSLLNEFFGLNDMDMNTYADRIKSDKYGIYNMSNIAFHGASRPDFFNRMMLFVALMKLDGVWEAYSIKDNLLIYDWKLDKRFDAYARGDKSDLTKYEYLKGLYYALAELLETEHAMNADGTLFKKGLPLPKAYTNLQIEGYKSVSDNLYGYYSHEKKAMVHALTMGSMWMLMRTFWSGKKNLYLGSPGVKLQGKYVQLKDQDGNLMWLKDENGEDTKVPLIRWEGLWLEGILLTIFNLIDTARELGFKTTIHDLWYSDDPNMELYRANIKLLIYDLTVFVAFAPMVAAMMAGWDDELKKEAKLSNDLADALAATAAHLACKIVSASFLDFNFIESIGGPITTWQPMSLSYLGRRLEDAGDVITGDKKLTDAVLRSFTATNQTKIFWDTLIAL